MFKKKKKENTLKIYQIIIPTKIKYINFQKNITIKIKQIQKKFPTKIITIKILFLMDMLHDDNDKISNNGNDIIAVFEEQNGDKLEKENTINDGQKQRKI